MARVITKENLKSLLTELATDYRVIAPTLKNQDSVSGKYAFREIKDGAEAILGYPTTVLPPKEHLLPPVEVLFSYKNGKIESPTGERPTILFGLTVEDLDGVARLKDIFERPVRDMVFHERTKALVTIGLDRFSPPPEGNFDLYLMKLSPELYAVFATSQKGMKILKNRLFSEKKMKIPTVKRTKDTLLARKDLPKIIENSRNHPVWKELSEICFGCGICSYVCPLCYCFETQDKNEIGTDCGNRCRTWDSCMLYHFAETSAGNFRPELEKRIYNWYYHKFVRMPGEYGYPGCVDCNRCVIYCPAKINYRKVLERLIKDAK